jgi:hypothetical protein
VARLRRGGPEVMWLPPGASFVRRAGLDDWAPDERFKRKPYRWVRERTEPQDASVLVCANGRPQARGGEALHLARCASRPGRSVVVRVAPGKTPRRGRVLPAPSCNRAVPDPKSLRNPKQVRTFIMGALSGRQQAGQPWD